MPRGVKTARSVNKAPRREFVTKDYDGSQSYGTVTKLLGNGRMLVLLEDVTERQCTVRGSMRRREWVNINDVVLVSFLDFDDTTADIIRRYTDAEATELRRLGELVAPRPKDDSDPDDVEIVFEDL